MSTIKLNTGDQIPSIGLGTWKMTPEIAATAVESAIQGGYRHIDCAWIYENEDGVGKGIQAALSNSDLSREDLWLTSKLWNDCHRPEHVRPALQQSLSSLGLEQLDLYLIHWPVAHKHGIVRPDTGADYLSLDEAPLCETWQAMEECASEGLCKNIGVSNFSIKKLEDLIPKSNIRPAVNQVECHPFFPQKQLLTYCQSNEIVLTAYSPLGSGDRPDMLKKENEPSLFEHDVATSIAKTHGVTSAQILLAWAVNRGTVPIPKSSTPLHQSQNLAAASLRLSDEEMVKLDSMNSAYRYVDGKFWERENGPYSVANLWDE